MINNLTNAVVENSTTPYPSLLELKETHTRLRKLCSEAETPSVLDEIETFIQRGSATGAILDNDDDRRLTQSYLDYWVTVLYRAKRIPSDATLAEFDPSLAPQLDDSLCPYKGLNAFQETDRNVFFGRERLVEAMTSALIDKRLLVVVGPSGSGKSSMVLAGLLPALKNGALSGSEHWQYFPPLVPGSNPLRNLAVAITPANKPSADWVTQQIQNLRQDGHHLVKTIQGLGNTPAVIVVDQFEEVFTLCTDDQLRNAFIENIVNLAEASDPKHLVILTLRSDYEPQIMSRPALIPLFERGHARTTPLASSDLYHAIEEPANRVGLRFEDGVVDALVKDILGEPAGLPLLQFALLRLWKMRDHNRITWLAYKNLGGARRALALTADEFYNGLIKEDQEVVEHILLRLARPSEGFEVTSNRVRRRTLYLAGYAKDRVDRVLNKLVDAGLVRLTYGEIPADDQVEVAHEALVRNWPTLVGWLEDERVTLRKRLRLTAAAEQWLELGNDPGALLAGSLLEEALEYDDLNDLETEFVRASQAAVHAAEREKETARQRELELERSKNLVLQQRNEWVVKNARRTRWFATVFAVVAFFAIFFAAIAARQRKLAVGSAQLATTNEEQARANAEKAQASAKEAAAARKLAEEKTAAAIESARLYELARNNAVLKSLEATRQRQIAIAQRQIAIAKAAEAEKARKETQAALIQTEKEKSIAKQQASELKEQATVLQAAYYIQGLYTAELGASNDLKDGNVEDALATYKDLVNKYAKIQFPHSQRRVLIQMAKIYHAQNNLAEEKKVQDQIDKLPTPIEEVLLKAIKEKGIESAVSQYRELRRNPSAKYSFSEDGLNNLGYLLLRANRVKEAIEIFKLNVEAFPTSDNTYDSLGEAYMIDGNKELAIKNYKKALELNPKKTTAAEALKKLGASQ